MSLFGNSVLAGSAGQGPSADLGDTIEQSLRFSGSQKLTRTGVDTTTGSTSGTISVWYKRGYKEDTSIRTIFNSPSDGSFQLNPSTNSVNFRVPSNTTGFASLGGKLRDPSAWYHVVYNYDSTNTRLWINGALVETVATTHSNILRAGNQFIGCAGTVQFFEGYLAEFIAVEGQTLDEEDFGRYNDDGVWVPIEYTGTYGTNGFHLTFDSSQTNGIGHDSSGNGNHFTATGFDTAPIGVWTEQLFSSTKSTIDFTSTSTAYNSATYAFDNNTSLATQTNATTDSSLIFRPAFPLTNVTQIRVWNDTADMENGYNGGNTSSATGGSWATVYSGPAITVNNIFTQSDNRAKINAIEVNGTVLVDNFDNDVDFLDTPTSNYATGNPIDAITQTAPNFTYNSANLAGTGTQNGLYHGLAGFSISLDDTNNYYWEIKTTGGSSSYPALSLYQCWEANGSNWTDKLFLWYMDGQRYWDGTTTSSALPSWSVGDICGMRFDGSNDTVYCSVNGGTETAYTLSSRLKDIRPGYLCPPQNSATVELNFGQMPFIYQPANSVAMQTNNLPEPTIKNGRDHFQAITGGGPGLGTWSEPNTNSINSPVDINNATSGPFYTLPVTPAGQRHWIHDFGFPQASVTHTHLATQTGLTYALSEDGTNWTVVNTNYTVTANAQITSTAAENGGNNVRYVRLYHPTTTWGIGLSAASGDTPILQAAQNTFPNGLWWIKDRQNSSQHDIVDSVRGAGLRFTCPTAGSEVAYSAPTGDSVAWCWNAGGAAVSNTDGTITSSVSANTDAGFSIVSYTGTGANATVGHGLTEAPDFVIYKRRNAANAFIVYSSELLATEYLHLNLSAAKNTGNTNLFNSLRPTNSVLNVGTSGSSNALSQTYITYCWHSVPGYSAFGTYTGNGNADGPFVYLGFTPALIICKCTSTTGSWRMFDSARSPNNVVNDLLLADTTGAETTTNQMDFLSNGFKIRSADNQLNGSGRTFVYMAVAESPFGGENAPPATAR